MLRSPDLSLKAKGMLTLLLSNQESVRSYITIISKMTKDGESSIRSGLQELEECGYLIRLRYRCKETKQFKGVFWGYTDTPGQLDFQKALSLLDEVGFE